MAVFWRNIQQDSHPHVYPCESLIPQQIFKFFHHIYYFLFVNENMTKKLFFLFSVQLVHILFNQAICDNFGEDVRCTKNAEGHFSFLKAD